MCTSHLSYSLREFVLGQGDALVEEGSHVTLSRTTVPRLCIVRLHYLLGQHSPHKHGAGLHNGVGPVFIDSALIAEAG